MNETTDRTSQSAADRAERYVREQLNPTPGQEHLSPLLKKRKDFLEQLNQNLDPSFYDTPEKRQAKLAEAGREFDEAIVARAREGAVAGGDANTYKMMDPAEKREKETSTGLIRGIINTVVGALGGMFGFLWDLLKHLPIVGDMISSIGDKRTPEEKARDTKAAGVADKLSVPIEIQGVTVAFTDDERARIFNGLRKPEAQTPTQPASAARPPIDPSLVPPDLTIPGANTDNEYNRRTAGLTVPPTDQGRPTTPAPVTTTAPAASPAR